MKKQKNLSFSKDEFHPLGSKGLIKELRNILAVVSKSVYPLKPPPAETVFASIKEVLHIAEFFFRHQHIDYKEINPDIQIKPAFRYYREGKEYERIIDTGMIASIKSYQYRPQMRKHVWVSDLMYDIQEMIIEIERTYKKFTHGRIPSPRPKLRKSQAYRPKYKNKSISRAGYSYRKTNHFRTTRGMSRQSSKRT